MFVTVFFAIFDSKTGELVYANGGHNPPVILHADGSSSLLAQAPGVALGIAPEFDYDMYNATLARGDALVLYTDGVTEAENEKTEQCRSRSPPGDSRGFAADLRQGDQHEGFRVGEGFRGQSTTIR